MLAGAAAIRLADSSLGLYTTSAMTASRARVVVSVLLACLFLTGTGFSSAYNARPKLIVVIVIDQFRGDYPERYRDQFGEGGFRLFLDHGAYFPDCQYDYANTRTAPGHATLFTGAYSSGHGIMANEWWDPQTKREVTSVEDANTRIVGIANEGVGASPHNLMASTLGDELKLATQGKSRVFGISLKDRGAILPAGLSGDGAYWIDKNDGTWITSTYYRTELPPWAKSFNESKRAEKYLNKDWKDSSGNVLRTTTPRKKKDGSSAGFYENVGSTPFANDYQFEFARELVVYEHLGSGPATDLLTISLSANDILGHQVGPDSPEMQAMALALDRQLADFFSFLGHELGLANVWIALSADHGISPLPATAMKLRILAANLDYKLGQASINSALNARFSPGKQTEFVTMYDYPLAWLNDEAFTALKIKEEDAERATGEVLKLSGLRGYFTRSQLAQGAVPDTVMGRQYLNSYSPAGGWYVMGVPPPYSVGIPSGTNHISPYTYDTHVPLALYGLAFQPGTYRQHSEPVDLAVTLASLLGINAPTHATGRVLIEALSAHSDNGSRPPSSQGPAHNPVDGNVKPASFLVPDRGAQ